jgi:hypothetical protein
VSLLGFPRAPLSKRRVYFDARNIEYPQAISYDRRGELWKTFEPGFSQYAIQRQLNPKRSRANKCLPLTDGLSGVGTGLSVTTCNPNVSLASTKVKKVQGGWSSGYDRESASDFISNYMTKSAMRRLGT